MHPILTKNQIALIFLIATLAVIVFQPELAPLLLSLFVANKAPPNMRRGGSKQIAETLLVFPCQQTFFNQKKLEWKVAPALFHYIRYLKKLLVLIFIIIIGVMY